MDFSDRNNEMSFGRTFSANITIPASSTLNQGIFLVYDCNLIRLGSVFSTRRLLLPDLASTPNPANYLWRLVSLAYFGGGCDTLDASMTDLFNQPNFCSQPYGINSVRITQILNIIRFMYELPAFILDERHLDFDFTCSDQQL